MGVLTFGVVNLATAGEETQTEVGKVKPKKLPKKKPKNIKYINTIETSNVPGTQSPDKANRTILDLPKNFKLNNKKFKTCKTDIAGLEGTTTEAAIKACGKKSVVSDPKGSSAVVTVSDNLDIFVDVTAINESKNVLILHSKPIGASDPSFNAFAAQLPPNILVGKLKKASKVKGRPSGATSTKNHKQALDVTIPLTDAGGISFFEVTIPKNNTVKVRSNKKKKGKKKKQKVTYIQAKCKSKKHVWRATTFFENSPPTFDDYKQKCKRK
ncbi:MAG TPA: hypothetical protein VKA36_10735 [Solirubrobacterales bacterium]|nr:hypothetical protein [Solirubrobacterales bacterium]